MSNDPEAIQQPVNIFIYKIIILIIMIGNKPIAGFKPVLKFQCLRYSHFTETRSW